VESLKIEFPHLLEMIFYSLIGKGCWRNRDKNVNYSKSSASRKQCGHPQVILHSSQASVNTGICKATPKRSLLRSSDLAKINHLSSGI